MSQREIRTTELSALLVIGLARIEARRQQDFEEFVVELLTLPLWQRPFRAIYFGTTKLLWELSRDDAIEILKNDDKGFFPSTYDRIYSWSYGSAEYTFNKLVALCALGTPGTLDMVSLSAADANILHHWTT